MNRGHLIGVVVLVVVCLAAPQSATAQTGAIKGQVLDAETMAPVVGATVMIVETQDGTAADASGSFTITDLAPGSYTVRVQSVGYAAQSLTDIIVRSNRSTPVPVRLALSAVALEGQTVETGYFRDSEEKQTSTIGFSTEEIRRSPGSAGDVSRIMFVLPSVAKVNDMVNNLIVRGGSPHENAFYLDGIEIPNINHFPFRGTTGGAIGLLNVDFIQDVEFSAGAFPATYGNRMSSVMDLQFREGTRDGFDGQLDLNFAGFGAAGEGPIGTKGSYLVSARRSYLDLLVDAVGIGVAPRYSDYQGKAVYDLSPAHRLSLIGVGSTDFIEFDREDALDIDDLVYGEYDNYLYAAGVNWRWLWGRSGYSTTSLSTLGTRQKSLFYETNTTKLWQRETALERAVQIRNVNHVRLSPSHHVEVGVEGKHRFDDYDTYTAEGTNPAGDTVPPIAYQKNVNADEVGAFVSYTWQAASRLSFTPGVRFDYFSLNENSHVSPRFSASLGLSERTTLTGAAGVYYQPLPLVLLSQHDEHLSLKDPRANHYVAGIRHLLSDDVQLTVEGYFKDYYDSPVDPEQPLLFTADEMVYRYFFG
ncbi:MAG TPA: TonB-dependent receptor, partial [candidate division Zixibacteria bacterium]|nr:TonB-dependent receptor [candidate division Zixibacteria bacterium]